MSEAPQGRGRDRWSTPHARGADAAAAASTAAEAAMFDSVVEPLLHDRAWRRRVGLVHLRHRAVTVSSWMLRGFAELGCWFACVPPHGRCSGCTAAAKR